MDFDYAFHPVIAGDLVYFGSSADDTVRALNIATGKEVWRFTTSGPVRFAPAIGNGKAYIASDDGWLYCVTAAGGELVWKFRGGPNDRQLLGNGRMISRWPLRNGVIAVDSIVYFTAGMWPTQGVYVYALDANTGEEIWCNDSSGNVFINLPHCGASGFSGVAPQGYLLASNDLLLVPTGRSVPAAFDRRTGRLVYYDPATATKDGGTWAMLCGDLYFSPRNPSWWHSHSHVGEAQPRFGDGMIVYDLATGDAKVALGSHYHVLAGNGTLYAAKVEETIEAIDLDALRKAIELNDLDAIRKARKSVKWAAAHPRVYSLALAGDALLVGGSETVSAFTASTGELVWKAAVEGQARSIAVARGRLLVATSKGRLVCFGPGDSGSPRHVEADAVTRALPESYTKRASALVEQTGVRRGYALILGEPDARLAEALARHTDLHVICALRDEATVRAERERLLAESLCGARVAVQALAETSRLPYAPYFADLIVVVNEDGGPSAKEIYRVLRPCGGQLVFPGGGPGKAFFTDGGIPEREISREGHGVTRGPLPGAGEWRHQWANGGRTGVGADSRVRLPLELLWFGGPGPDRMMDRTGASPPLSVRGRVFVTGEHHVLAMDAYTGRELWCRRIEKAGRLGVRQTSSNFAADDNTLYLSIEDTCLRLDQATGKTLGVYQVPSELTDAKRFTPGFVQPEEYKLGTNEDMPAQAGWGWGYLGVTSDMLLGSYRMPVRYVKKLHDMVPWQDPRYSNSIFALRKKDGALLWVYHAKRGISGVNIAFGGGRLFLLDATPNPDIYGKAKRRGDPPDIKRTLIALNLADGAEAWRCEDIPSLPKDRVHTQFANGVVVLGANVAFDAKTGKKLWEREVSPVRPPVIQGDWVIDMSRAYDLRTGAVRTATDTLTGQTVPWRFMRSRGCGNIAGSQALLFFRAGCYGFFEPDSGGFTTFGGGRPNCALAIIAANGLILCPESSSGCECSYNYQTSLALVPTTDRTRTWYALAGLRETSETSEVRQLRVNLGAPGDRRDRNGVAWLGFPRIGIRRKQRVAVPITPLVENPVWRSRPSALDAIKETQMPWLYTSAMVGQGNLAIDVTLSGQGVNGVVVPECAQPPTVDGVLDDACWQDALPIPFAGGGHLADPLTSLFMRRDAETLYFGYRRKAVVRNGKVIPFVGTRSGADAECWKDDSFEIVITRRDRRYLYKALHFAVSCSGGRSDGLIRSISSEQKPKTQWNGEWASAVRKGVDEWTAEVAIPWKTLKKEGLSSVRRRLQFNFMSRNVSGYGVERVFLIDPDLQFYRGRHYLPMISEPPPAPSERTFTVRLHFAERDEIKAGERRFDVLLQGKPVLKDFDIVKEAGERWKPVIREFRGVKARGRILLELRAGTAKPDVKSLPLINALEVIEEDSAAPE